MTEKGKSILAALPLGVAVRITLNVPSWVKSDPKRATLVPSTFMKEGRLFKV
jgi:hypothetical protein